jgi:RNA polymerase sigma-70 factor, ECF subfamily
MTITNADPSVHRLDGENETSKAAKLSARFVHEAMPFADELSRKARSLTHNDADAEDLMQETLLRAYAGFANFQSGSNIRAWLYRIQINTWINLYRARTRRPDEWPTDMITDAQMAREPRYGSSRTCSAEDAALEELPADEVTAALRQLHDHQRVVVYLADVEGLPYKDIASITGTPIGTVMSRIHRGRKALRVLLDDFAYHHGHLRNFATMLAPTAPDTAIRAQTAY